MEGLTRSLGYDSCFAVSSDGRSGGLGLFWRSETQFSLLRFSGYHIDGEVRQEGRPPWRFTLVHGEAQRSERYKTWDLLKFIKCESDLPWLCAGDFNKVLKREEHRGIGRCDECSMQGFREAVDV